MTKRTKQHKSPRHSHHTRVNGHLHRVVPIVDNTGKIISYALKPLMVELHFRDIMQIIVGAVLLAIPVGFTEEVWVLSQELTAVNILGIAFLSVVFIAMFVYLNFYRHHSKGFEFEFIKRVIAVYFLSCLVVAALMTLIGKAPWTVDLAAALKLVVIVAFPASMSATLSDMIK